MPSGGDKLKTPRRVTEAERNSRGIVVAIIFHHKNKQKGEDEDEKTTKNVSRLLRPMIDDAQLKRFINLRAIGCGLAG
jgi:hypothetical protein